MSFRDSLGVLEFSSMPEPDISNRLRRDFSNTLILISIVNRTPAYLNLLILIVDGPELSPFRARREVLTEIQLDLKNEDRQNTEQSFHEEESMTPEVNEIKIFPKTSDPHFPLDLSSIQSRIRSRIRPNE